MPMKGVNIVIAIVFTVILAVITIGIIFAIIGMTPQEIEKGTQSVTSVPEEELSFYNYDDLLEKPTSKLNIPCDVLKSCMLYTFKYKKPCQLGVFSLNNSPRTISRVLGDLAACEFDVTSYIAPKIEQFLCENTQKYIFAYDIISDANGLYFYNMNMKKADFYDGSSIDPQILDRTGEAINIIYVEDYFSSGLFSDKGLYRLAVMKTDVNQTNKKCIVLIGITRYPYIAKEKNEPSIKIFDAMRTINFNPSENDWRVRKVEVDNNNYYRLNTIFIDVPDALKFEYGYFLDPNKIVDAIKFGLYANPTLRQYNFSTPHWIIDHGYSNKEEDYLNPWSETLTDFLSNHEQRAIFGWYAISQIAKQIIINVGWSIKEKDGKKYIIPVVAWGAGPK